MEMKPCESSNIQACGFDPDTSTLAIQFKGKGTVYHYAGVTPEIYEKLRSAPSLGQFFQLHIRGKFTTKKIA